MIDKEKEIVQALRCCRLGKPCTSCPAAGRGKGICSFDEVHAGAVAAIERLTAENAALREKQRWISVTEKTPEYDMPQLALNADGDALIANYAYGEWFDTWGQDVEVTHWMPLPDAAESAGARLEMAYCEYIKKEYETWND